MSATTLAELAIGAVVHLKRNLSHPAWNDMHEDQYGDIHLTLREGVEESLGTALVTETRYIPAIAGWCGREEKNLVRLSNGFWYDTATGLQDGSEATRIEVG